MACGGYKAVGWEVYGTESGENAAARCCNAA